MDGPLVERFRVAMLCVARCQAPEETCSAPEDYQAGRCPTSNELQACFVSPELRVVVASATVANCLWLCSLKGEASFDSAVRRLPQPSLYYWLRSPRWAPAGRSRTT